MTLLLAGRLWGQQRNERTESTTPKEAEISILLLLLLNKCQQITIHRAKCMGMVWVAHQCKWWAKNVVRSVVCIHPLISNRDQRISSSLITCHRLFLPKLPAPKYLVSELPYSHLTPNACPHIHAWQTLSVCMLTWEHPLKGNWGTTLGINAQPQEKAVLKEELLKASLQPFLMPVLWQRS